MVSLFPKSVKAITIGSEVSRVNIVVASEYVSALHCKLERKGTTLRATDLSKNGTFFEGQRERWFYLRPGKTFIAGALPHCFLALNDPMRESYPELVDLLGAANEHVIGSLRDTPSPSDVIVAAVAGAPILITSEPDCDQHRLARIIHRVSRCCEREIVERTPKDLPADHKAQDELIKKRARRSTATRSGSSSWPAASMSSTRRSAARTPASCPRSGYARSPAAPRPSIACSIGCSKSTTARCGCRS
ncbi:MAG: FHA domain-containing protein [Deltaproteobacteria bacterium]|nr:MAG: FHA domain-containing protein [Deltaproteobacteria bacterium]